VDAAGTVADAVSQLRRRGLRATPARLQVIATLRRAHHASLEDIQAGLAVSVPGSSPSTVYRTVETLEAHGILSHTHVAEGRTAYQLADEATHAHLVCRSCRQVTLLPEDVANRLVADVSNGVGFDIDTGHLSVFGRCARCIEVDLETP
jgi:Fur family ferric uptake transcriptional regulator